MHRRTASTAASPTVGQTPSFPSPVLPPSSASSSSSRFPTSQARPHPPPVTVYPSSAQYPDGLLSPVSPSSVLDPQRRVKRRASTNELSVGEQHVRYLVRTSDAIDTPRVDVLLENGGRKIWTKTRELEPHTIVSKLEDLDHPSISYSLTRPLTHFSLAISSPLFPRSSSIPLRIEPVPDEDGGGVEIEVIVSCRVDLDRGVPPPAPMLASPSNATFSSITTSTFSPQTTYPPPPPSRLSAISSASSRTSTSSLSPSVREGTIPAQSLRFTVLPGPHPLFHQPPGSHNHHLSVPHRMGGSVGAREERVPLSPTPRSLDVRFGEDDHAVEGGTVGRQSRGSTWGRKLGRVWGDIVGGWSGRGLEGPAKYKGKSFHLLPPPHLFPPLPPPAINPRPIVTFHDTTPFLSATTQGVLILDEGLVRVLGVERGFWIAVALAALEIEEDREGYLAAQDG